MKPLIHLYKTPIGYYFFETQRSEIVTISKELFNYIQAILDGDMAGIHAASELVKNQYEELYSYGYLQPSYIKELKHPATEFLPLALERKVERILLQVTQSCNLRCHYCVYSETKNINTRSHSNNSMTFETAKKAVDFYSMHSIDSDEKTIGFYGGEPLIEFGLIKKVIEYANTVFRGKDLLYSITTNGTLLNDEMIEFFIANNVNVTVSIDGPKPIHDKNRKFANGSGSFDIIMKNLEKLREKSPLEMPFSLSMVIDSDNEYEKIVELFNQPIMKNIGITAASIEEDNISKPVSDEYFLSYQKDMFLGLVSHFRSEKKTSNKLIGQDIGRLEEYLQPNIIHEETAPGGPCVPGKMRLFVDCFGNLYPCERVSETVSEMKIGTLDAGFDVKKADALLNVSRMTEDACKNCWAFPLCTVCAKCAVLNGTFDASKKLSCCADSKDSALKKILEKTLVYEINQHEKKIHQVKGRVL